MRLSVLLCCFVLCACTSDLPASCTEELLRCLNDPASCRSDLTDKYKQAQEACAPTSHVEERIIELGPRQMDWLFVIDNSRGMAAKQQELALKLAPLLGQLSSYGDWHIGVISTDLGMNPLPGIRFPGLSPGHLAIASADGQVTVYYGHADRRFTTGPIARRAGLAVVGVCLPCVSSVTRSLM